MQIRPFYATRQHRTLPDRRRGLVRRWRGLHGDEAECMGVLMGIELVLNGANVNFVAFEQHAPDSEYSIGLDGQAIAVFVIVLAAAEAAVALAITLNFYNNHATVDVDRADELKG